ncbi:MAG: peptidylprolyl isomerase [Planctomycetota bacterium]|nr:peptidylprolyl isomerase [Planctomycetota bacterium]
MARPLAAAIALFLGLLSLGSNTTAQSKAPEAPPPAIRLDGTEITLDAFARWLVRNIGERQSQVFGKEYWGVEREARALGVEVTDEECARRVDADVEERIDKAFLGKKSEWLAELERTRRTESGVRLEHEIELRPLVLAEKIVAIDRVVPEQKIERDWEFQYGRKGRHYDLSMTKVLVVVPSGEKQNRDEWKAGREKVMAEGLEKARAVRARILSGEDFGKVARETSDDPETRDGRGVPPRGFSHFGWPSTFLDALEKLQVGEVSEPIFARGGWWVLRVNGVQETPLASVRDALRAKLERKGPEPDEVAAVLERIRAATTVRILPAMYESGGDPELDGPNQPVLEVDGEPVPRKTFARWLVAIQGESMMQPFVEEFAIDRAARAAGITVTQDEIDERVRWLLKARIDEAHKGSRESWLTFLSLNGRTEESFARTLAARTRSDLLAEKLYLRERKVTPEEVKQRFVSEYGADGERIEARWIVLVNVFDAVDPKWTREELTKAMMAASERGGRRAAELVARIRAGDDFAALAREQSDDKPTRAAGGRIEGRFRGDAYPDGFGAVVSKLAVGEVSEPLDYGNAWAIFQVTARRKVTFAEVESELLNELKTMRPSGLQVNSHRNFLSQKVKVELLPGLTPR